MTEQDLSDFLHAQGWYLDIVERWGQGKKYAYAKRREGAKVKTKYISALTKLHELTSEDVARKLK